MWKVTPSKSLVIRINLIFISCFLFIYATLLLRQPSTTTYRENATSYIRCSLRDCHHKVEPGYKMKAVLIEDAVDSTRNRSNTTNGLKTVKRERPSFLNGTGFIGRGMRIGTVNMDGEDMSDWNVLGKTIPVKYEKVSELFEWKDLFPEWIDEEEEMHQTLCPEIPMPEYEKYGYMDMIVVNIPCKFPDEGWRRDVYRLQLHLIAANLAVRRGRRSWSRKPKVVVLSKCRPMVEIFRCDDLLKHDGDWWFYEPDIKKLEQKVYLPVGTCSLALPLWGKGNDEVYDADKIKKTIPILKTKSKKREAYATVLHSSESYVCGAIMLAQSLLRTNTDRDLILLIDNSISFAKRQALAAAGWTIRIIERIRNPRAEKDSYNEYNYSKFRLWQLTDYAKIIFIDSDIIVQRNLDVIFSFPQMSAVGNDNSIFNSGIMIIEPSNCTFKHFMQQTEEIVSYNGGDQGFLNEIFVYWHRLPRRVNFLKNFWSNTTVETSMKNQLFGADPPKLYAIHYLGLKPWACYRDYDCNWDIGDQRVYASDVAHRTWWKLHDTIDESLQEHCKLTKQRKIELKWDRMQAKKIGFPDEHWRINVTDPRRRG